jgi:sugar lactone lactonase YvrE
MKLPVPKTCNPVVTVLALCVIMIVCSCNDEVGNPCDLNNGEGSGESAKPTLSLDSFAPHDYGNEGNASDIFLSCEFSGSLDRFEKLRFIVRTSASGFNLVKALKLPESSYVEMDVAGSMEASFPQTMKDADGKPISEGKPYFIFILGLPTACSGIPVLIEGPETLTLVDEIVVMTPKLKNTLSANEDISIDQENNLYISGGSVNTSSLFKVTPDGTVTTLSNTLNYPVGNTVDDNGNLYVTNFGSIDINLVTPAGVTSVFISDERLFRGGGIIRDNDGALYNTFYAIKTIYRITAAGVENYLTNDLLSGPVGMAYDEANDHIFVANFNDGKIHRVTRDKVVTEVAAVPATIGHLDYRENVLYATGYYQHKVFVVSTDGEILATIGNGNQATVDGSASEASFFNPNGIAVSKDGKYLYISQQDGKLRKIIL